MLSLVLPVLNEADGLPQLVDRLASALSAMEEKWEIIVVDDGSRDGTAEVAKKLLSVTPFAWKILRLSRNFGHQPAYLAGIRHASGDAVVCMDADLQDPPEIVPRLVDAWKNGAKLVAATRLSRVEKGWRKWLFGAFHAVFHRLTGGVMPRNSGNFGLMDRVVVDKLVEMRETNLFLPALRAWIGYPLAEVPYHREGRAEGNPRMNWRRLMNLAWDGLTSFSTVPLRVIGWTGLFVAVPCMLWGAWLIAQRIFQFFGFFRELQVLGFTTLAVGMFFLGGVQLICLGVIGEYLGRIYREVKGRPQYVLMSVEQSGPPAGN